MLKGNPVSNGKITFVLNGKNIGSVAVNSKGVASITLTAKILKTAKAGNKNLKITYNGDYYNTVSKTVKVKINKEKKNKNQGQKENIQKIQKRSKNKR